MATEHNSESDYITDATEKVCTFSG